MKHRLGLFLFYNLYEHYIIAKHITKSKILNLFPKIIQK